MEGAGLFLLVLFFFFFSGHWFRTNLVAREGIVVVDNQDPWQVLFGV